MDAKAKSTREQQQALTEKNLALRIQQLKDKGKSDDQISRDAAVRKLKAKIRDAKNRIKSIDKYDGIIKEARRQKEEKDLQVKDKSKKKEEKPAETDKKGKQKKKKQPKAE